MKNRLYLAGWLVICAAVICTCFAQSRGSVLVMIAEQNIEGPRSAWWASEIDLSATEAAIVQSLLASGIEVAEPSEMADLIRKDKAYRMVDVSERTSLQLASAAKAEYLVIGKAVASAGGMVLDSAMRSCYANVTAKLIRVKDKKVIAYLDAAGSSVHPDVISGGREALVSAGRSIGAKLVEALTRPAVQPASGK